MDYCSSCRRHLNGALVCPGCGAYAPDIAPSTAGGRTVPAARGAMTRENPAGDTWYDGYFRDEAPSADAHDTAPSVPSGDVDGAPAVPEGRAARRRQRARWKKNQRRAVVATAVALVGGGLTVSALDRGAGDKAQAATAPEHPNAGQPERQHTELTRPASTPPDTPDAPRTDTATSKPSPTNAARESVTAPRTTRDLTRPDAAATPSAAATSAPQSQNAAANPGAGNSGGSGGTGGTEAEQQAPTPTPTEGSDSGPSTSPTSPAPEATSPAQLCVLNLLCVG